MHRSSSRTRRTETRGKLCTGAFRGPQGSGGNMRFPLNAEVRTQPTCPGEPVSQQPTTRLLRRWAPTRGQSNCPRPPGTRKRRWAAEPGKCICASGPGGSGRGGHVDRQEGPWEPGEGATVLLVETQLVCATLGSSPGSATYYDGTQDMNPQ